MSAMDRDPPRWKDLPGETDAVEARLGKLVRELRSPPVASERRLQLIRDRLPTRAPLLATGRPWRGRTGWVPVLAALGALFGLMGFGYAASLALGWAPTRAERMLSEIRVEAGHHTRLRSRGYWELSLQGPGQVAVPSEGPLQLSEGALTIQAERAVTVSAAGVAVLLEGGARARLTMGGSPEPSVQALSGRVRLQLPGQGGANVRVLAPGESWPRAEDAPGRREAPLSANRLSGASPSAGSPVAGEEIALEERAVEEAFPRVAAAPGAPSAAVANGGPRLAIKGPGPRGPGPQGLSKGPPAESSLLATSTEAPQPGGVTEGEPDPLAPPPWGAGEAVGGLGAASAAEAAQLAKVLEALRRHQDVDRARRELDIYRTRFPRGVLGPEATLTEVELLLRTDQRQEALRILDGVPLQSFPLAMELHLLRGDLRAGAQRCGQALQDYTWVLDDPQGSAAVRERALRGRILCKLPKDSAAPAAVDGELRRDLRAYLAQFPRAPFAADARKLLGETPQ